MPTNRAVASLTLVVPLAFVLAAIQFAASVSGGDTESQFNPQDPRHSAFTLDCAADAKPISPLIYGIGGNDNPWATGTTAVRVGGNPMSRYNWELDASN